MVLVVICFGTACGTVRRGRSTAQAASPLTPALSPLRGEGGEAGTAGFSGEGHGQDARFARADSVGRWGSPESQPAGKADGGAVASGRVLRKWNPVWWFGNADDLEPPAWYRPGSANRRWLWRLRNPFHNFTFYVVGVADKPFTRTGRFPETVFAPGGGWNWAVARHKWVRLPFVSFNGKWCRFYVGWRERGNLGCKVNVGRLAAPDHRRQNPAPDSVPVTEKK